MASEKFRRQLRQEAELWWKEEIIDASLYETLSQRYQFAGLEGEASNRFLGILLGLGAVLLGLGAITFIAANWQGWSRVIKVSVLLSGLVGVNTLGFYLWRSIGASRAAGNRRRWGHALLILGVFILGANLGLLPQMFHQGGPVAVLFLLWGTCVALMAYGLRLTSLGFISLVLLMSGYFSGFGALESPSLDVSLWSWVSYFMPLVIVGIFLPLAYWCRSQVIFGLGAIAFVITFNLNLFWSNGFWRELWPSWLLGSLVFLCPALLWAFDRDMWQLSGVWRSRRAQLAKGSVALQQNFRAIARVIAIILLCFNLYAFSFHTVWQGSSQDDFYGTFAAFDTWTWAMLADEVLLLLGAMLGWMALLKQFPGFRKIQLRALNSAMVLLLIAVPVGLYCYAELVQPLPIVAPYVLNILLALLAIGLIRDGLAEGSRSFFWCGMVVLVLDILTRMFEYDTALMLKALAFTLCGIGVLIAGIWFERKSQARPARKLSDAPAS